VREQERTIEREREKGTLLQVAKVKIPIPKVVVKFKPSVVKGKKKCCKMKTVVIHKLLPTNLTKLSLCLKINATTKPVKAVTVTTSEKAGRDERVVVVVVVEEEEEIKAAKPAKTVPQKYKYV